MAIHPLVYFENDAPSSSLRLKMAIKLLSACFFTGERVKEQLYIMHLQRYYFSKTDVDIETLYDYEEFMEHVHPSVIKYKTFEEADEAVATVEALSLKRGKPLTPYTSLIAIQQDENELNEPMVQSMNEVIEKQEEEFVMKRNYAESKKGVSMSAAAKNANVERMTIPVHLQGNNASHKGFKLLIRNKNGAALVGNTIAVELTDAQKKQRHEKMERKKQEAEQLKTKTMSLNNVETEETRIQSIHNEKVKVCPQANSRRNNYFKKYLCFFRNELC